MNSATEQPAWLLGAAALLVAVLLSVGSHRSQLWDRDEPRNAGCAREMMDRADWVVPVFNANLRTDKPILLYWFLIASYSLFGVNEFAARLPSALLSVGTCLLTYSIGSRLANRRVGLLAMVVLATTFMFNVAAHWTTPDATLIFFMTASLAWYVHFAWPHRPLAAHADFPALLPSIAIYATMGLAVLAKGPVGFLLPCAIIGLFLLIRRSQESAGTEEISQRPWIRPFLRVASVVHPLRFVQTVWQMRPITLAVTVLAVAGPWYLLVGLRTDGEWLKGFFLDHNLRRATSTMEGHAGGILWFYPLAILVGFFPWSVWAIPAAINTRDRMRDAGRAASVLFLLCWIAVIVGMFSIAKTKLASYVTPTYPAIAVLVAWSLLEPAPALARRLVAWRRTSDAVLLLVAAGLGIILYLAAQLYLPNLAWLAAAAIIPAFTAVLGWRQASSSPTQWAAIHAVGAAALLAAVFGLMIPAVSRERQYDTLVATVESRPEIPVATLGCLEPSWVFYSGKPWHELDYPSGPPDRSPITLNAAAAGGSGHERLDTYLAQTDRTWLVVTEHAWHRISAWHDRFEPVRTVPLFLRPERLIVLRSRSNRARPPAEMADRPKATARN